MQSEDRIQPPESACEFEIQGLTPLEWRTLMTFWGVMYSVDAALDHDLRAESGLSHRDYQILVMLSYVPDHQLRMSELADIIFESRSRLTYQITQLERSGLVRREDCPTDKRGAVAVLTPRGQEVLQAITPGHIASARRVFFDRLSSEQVGVLGDMLQRILMGFKESATLARTIEREVDRRQEEVE